MNNLAQIRGNPAMEKQFGQMLGGAMPSMPALPSQTMQSGKGQLAKTAAGHGFNKAQRFGLLSESMTSFLSRYAGGLRYGEIKPAISTHDLLSM